MIMFTQDEFLIRVLQKEKRNGVKRLCKESNFDTKMAPVVPEQTVWRSIVLAQSDIYVKDMLFVLLKNIDLIKDMALSGKCKEGTLNSSCNLNLWRCMSIEYFAHNVGNIPF